MKKKYKIQRKDLQDDLGDSASEMDEYSRVLTDIADDVSDLKDELEQIISAIGRGDKRKKIVANLDQLICAFEMRYSRAGKVHENFAYILRWLHKSREFILEKGDNGNERRST